MSIFLFCDSYHLLSSIPLLLLLFLLSVVVVQRLARFDYRASSLLQEWVRGKKEGRVFNYIYVYIYRLRLQTHPF